jgi:hypothetical protein
MYFIKGKRLILSGMEAGVFLGGQYTLAKKIYKQKVFLDVTCSGIFLS